MKKQFSKTEIKKEIDSFFRRDSFTQDEMRKTKTLAMKYRIKLGEYRKLFCKNCFSKLAGEIRIAKKQKTVKCSQCGFTNRILLK